MKPNPVLAGVCAVASAGMIMAPLLPWVGVRQDAFLLISAQSQTWTALDELPGINNVPGWLALGSGVVALALVAAGLLFARRVLVAWSAAAALGGMIACGLFVLQLKDYQEKYENDVVARLAQAVLNIRGGLEAGWYLALGCSVVLAFCALGQLVRKSG